MVTILNIEQYPSYNEKISILRLCRNMLISIIYLLFKAALRERFKRPF